MPPRRVPSEPIRIVAYDAAANTTSTLSLSVIVCGCAEGGSCIQVTTPNFDANNYYQEQCMCSAAYEGDFCEEDVDGCRQNPCQDPSLCEDVPAPAVGFVCTGCLAGYALNGSMCEGICVWGVGVAGVCVYVPVCTHMCVEVPFCSSLTTFLFHCVFFGFCVTNYHSLPLRKTGNMTLCVFINTLDASVVEHLMWDMSIVNNMAQIVHRGIIVVRNLPFSHSFALI